MASIYRWQHRFVYLALVDFCGRLWICSIVVSCFLWRPFVVDATLLLLLLLLSNSSLPS